MGMLPDAETFKRLVDGSTPGVGAEAARLALAAVALPYGLAVAARNAAYDRGLLHVSRVPTPVISVGNLTLGGTGKTPLVAWVARRLAAAGRRPAIVSRGSGRELANGATRRRNSASWCRRRCTSPTVTARPDAERPSRPDATRRCSTTGFSTGVSTATWTSWRSMRPTRSAAAGCFLAACSGNHSRDWPGPTRWC